MAQVTVSIDGKQYRMACDEGQEEHLIDLAERFDRYVSHLKDSFGEIGDQRLTVMAGIMVMDELSELTKRVKGMESEVLTLMEKGFTAGEAARLMQVSRHTVVTFVRRIYLKLGVGSKTEAIFEARSLGLLPA